MLLSSDNTYSLKSGVRLSFATPMGRSIFFGYYDKSPLDASGKKLLAHVADFDGRDVTASDCVEVGWFDIDSGAWNAVGRTGAFNWQQGSMLQWLGPDFDSRIIYNAVKDNHFISIVVDIRTGACSEVPFPVYAVHPDGKAAVGVNFERHYFCRAYHYEGIVNCNWNVPLHSDDGLFRVNLCTGHHEQIVRTEDVAAIAPAPNSETDFHWLEHVWMGPTGRRFLFLHRHGHGENYRTRLFSTNMEGSDLYHFPDDRLYSHAAWRTDTEFAIWTKNAGSIAQAYANWARQEQRWPLKRAAVSAYRWAKRSFPAVVSAARTLAPSGFTLRRDQTTSAQLMGRGILTQDGHPSWTRDGRFMLMDTYPDAKGYRHLLLYDARKNVVHELGRFFSTYNNCAYRCDLHPRFSPEERCIIVDSAHNLHRQQLILEINWEQIVQEVHA